MAQLVTICFRLTKEREDTLRRELGITGEGVPLRNVVAYYAIRDTVYAWLDGGEAVLDPDPEDDLGDRRAFVASDRPYRKKLTIKKRPKS